MDVSIIIPVYRRVEWIARCVENLREQDFRGSFDVFIVDDGSPNEDEIKKMVQSLLMGQNPTVTYIRRSHAGPAAARNYGVKSSSGKIVCFLDDDSISKRNWLREITEPFGNSVFVALVSGKILSFDRAAPLQMLLERAIYTGKSWATCNIAYRRDVFEKLGGFDESFPEPSWEDNDLGIRARWAGFEHIHNEKAIVFHPHEKTIEEYKKKCLLNGRGAAVFSRKYLFKKPLWGIGVPFIMSRRLFYGILPSVWKISSLKEVNEAYVKFLWSFYSLKGFIGSLSRKSYAKN